MLYRPHTFAHALCTSVRAEDICLTNSFRGRKRLDMPQGEGGLAKLFPTSLSLVAGRGMTTARTQCKNKSSDIDSGEQRRTDGWVDVLSQRAQAPLGNTAATNAGSAWNLRDIRQPLTACGAERRKAGGRCAYLTGAEAAGHALRGALWADLICYASPLQSPTSFSKASAIQHHLSSSGHFANFGEQHTHTTLLFALLWQ